ncbi:MAG: PD-(D/E)XK nuclease family protein, partial [bacterium]|nr:PD-(D/E)XK nuclease family protein [bacterium]
AAFHGAYPSNGDLASYGQEQVVGLLDAEIGRALEHELGRARNASLAQRALTLAALRERAADYGGRYVRWMLAQPSFRVRDRELTVDFAIEDGAGDRHAFTGRIDRIDEVAEGVVIRDYKSGPWHPFASRFRRLAGEPGDGVLPIGKVDGCVQLPLYAAAVREREPAVRVVALDLLFLRGRHAAERSAVSRTASLTAGEPAGRSPRGESIAQDELAQGLRRIGALCSDLRAGRASYEPHPGRACETCAYRLACGRGLADDELPAAGDAHSEEP